MRREVTLQHVTSRATSFIRNLAGDGLSNSPAHRRHLAHNLKFAPPLQTALTMVRNESELSLYLHGRGTTYLATE